MDYLSDLSNEDLRRLIAGAKGWRVMQTTPCFVMWPPDDNRHGWTNFIPLWSTDIAVAWQLVEEMQKLEHVIVDICNGMVECSVDNFVRTLYGHGDTASRAICLAWLKWQDSKVAA